MGAPNRAATAAAALALGQEKRCPTPFFRSFLSTISRTSMSDDRARIYLDNAATSWPKSDAVLNAMDRFARQCGAAAGRGGYRSASQADAVVGSLRRGLADMIHAESPHCISLHANGTAALNAAIHGLLRDGDHVVTTAAEHNSVLRPLHHLQQTRNVRLTIVPCDRGGRVSASEVLGAVETATRLVALTHASNVTGVIQPVEAVGEGLRRHHAHFLCDAAQTFGYLPIDVRELGIDLLAAPGHKGSGGPLGTGFLYVRDALHDQITATIHGGTGSHSESLEMPTEMPGKLESGNLNVPALAGWTVALRQRIADDATQLAARQTALARQLYHGLAQVDGLRVFASPSAVPRLPIASVQLDMPATDASAILDAEFGIETRAGLHCAALIHAQLGSGRDGTLRVSGGHATTPDQIDTFLKAISAIAAAVR